MMQTNLLSILPDNRFQCKCGSILQQRSLSAHLKSQKHQKYIASEQKDTEECPICMENPQVDRYACVECKNTHCMNCHSNMTKCPYCRTPFPLDPEVESEQFFWTEIVSRIEWILFCIRAGIDTYLPEYNFILQHEHRVARWFRSFPVFLQDFYRIHHYIVLHSQ